MTNKLSQKQVGSIGLALVSLLFIAGITFRATAQGDDNLMLRVLSTLTDRQFGLAQIKKATDDLKKATDDLKKEPAKAADDVKRELAKAEAKVREDVAKAAAEAKQDAAKAAAEVEKVKEEIVDPRHGLKKIEEGVQTVQDKLMSQASDNPALQPFAMQFGADGEGRFTVPTGKRLVIEFFTVNAFGSDDGFYIPVISATTNSKFVNHFMAVTVQKNAYNRLNLYVGSQQTRIYADPGTDVITRADFASTKGITGSMSVSGHFVNLP